MPTPRNRVRIDQFDGLYSNRGLFAPTPSSASAQSNIRSFAHGNLSVRYGLRVVNGTSVAVHRSMYYYERSEGAVIVTATDSGTVSISYLTSPS